MRFDGARHPATAMDLLAPTPAHPPPTSPFAAQRELRSTCPAHTRTRPSASGLSLAARRTSAGWPAVDAGDVGARDLPAADEPGHAAHLRERSLTAAQRFALSLWLDGLDAVWTVDGLPEGDDVRAAGIAIGAADPVGLLWIPTPRAA